MSRANRYSGISIALHWLMVLLIIASYTFIPIRSEFPKGSEPRALVIEAALKMLNKQADDGRK
ncbi:MAG: hypothetical protein Q8M37_02045 [Nevskia sp.]|nr:hypothetical protein [Nevskia sp.]